MNTAPNFRWTRSICEADQAGNKYCLEVTNALALNSARAVLLDVWERGTTGGGDGRMNTEIDVKTKTISVPMWGRVRLADNDKSGM